MGLQFIQHLWDLLFFYFIIIIIINIIFYYYFFLSSLLVRIYFSLPFKVHEFLFILGLFIQQRGPRLGNLILTCKMLDAKSIAYLLP